MNTLNNSVRGRQWGRREILGHAVRAMGGSFLAGVWISSARAAGGTASSAEELEARANPEPVLTQASCTNCICPSAFLYETTDQLTGVITYWYDTVVCPPGSGSGGVTGFTSMVSATGCTRSDCSDCIPSGGPEMILRPPPKQPPVPGKVLPTAEKGRRLATPAHSPLPPVSPPPAQPNAARASDHGDIGLSRPLSPGVKIGKINPALELKSTATVRLVWPGETKVRFFRVFTVASKLNALETPFQPIATGVEITPVDKFDCDLRLTDGDVAFRRGYFRSMNLKDDRCPALKNVISHFLSAR